MTLVPAVKTPLTLDEAILAFAVGFPGYRGRAQGEEAIAVRELKRAGYFTASERLYYDGGNGRGGVLAIYRQVLPRVTELLGSQQPDAPPHELHDYTDLVRRVAELENWRERVAKASTVG